MQAPSDISGPTLFWSPRSPFARKVMVAAHERSLAGQLTLKRVLVASTTLDPQLMAHNPLNRIPTLRLEDGSSLVDSGAICAHLDRRGDAPPLMPSEPTAREAIQRWQVFGDGLMELGVTRLVELARPEPLRSLRHLDAYQRKTVATLDLLEHEADRWITLPLHIGQVSIACALAHLDFRFEADRWREGRPSLASWFDDFSRRPSMRATAFSDER